VESVDTCPIDDIWGNALSSVSPISYDIGCRCATYNPFHVEVCSFCSLILLSFYHEWMLNNGKAFFFICSDYQIDFAFFILCFIILIYVKLFMHHWNETSRHGVWFCVLLNSVCKYCTENFLHFINHRNWAIIFLFPLSSLSI
jgi:hypothetical protein